MKSNLNVWQELYTVIQQWNEIKPWTYIGSNDWIKISFENEDSFYCSIMGQMNDCIGISIYTGDEGYSDLMSITAEPIDKSVTKYLMYDQTCLTVYMGDREEVPPQQKQIIQQKFAAVVIVHILYLRRKDIFHIISMMNKRRFSLK